MEDFLRRQSGVVSRAQLLTLGCLPHDVARLLRQRRLSRVHPGVFVDHTGALTWEQRAWAAVLHSQHIARGPDPESAALHAGSALAAFEGATPRATDSIAVVVADGRKVRAPDGVQVVRSTQTLARVQWHLGPPRVRYEDAVIDVASSRRRTVDVVAEISRAVGGRRTTAPRLSRSLSDRPRVAQRDLLAGVLDDVATGACSVLEHCYLTRVERPHGLPSPARQARGRSRTSVTYRDADYGGLVVELDGRVWHDSVEQRDMDADRDLVTALSGTPTVRLTWGQVCDRSCWTAAHLARLLDVTPRRCGPGCVATDL